MKPVRDSIADVVFGAVFFGGSIVILALPILWIFQPTKAASLTPTQPGPIFVTADCGDFEAFASALTSNGVFAGTQPQISTTPSCCGDSDCGYVGVVTPAASGTPTIPLGARLTKKTIGELTFHFIDIRKKKK
jgi:hypothetical protein